MEYKIIPMQEKHIPGVLEIERVSFPTPWSGQAFLGELKDNDFAHYYVCVHGDEVAGYAGMWIIIDEAHVTNIAVHPNFRGKKLGKALLVNLMQEAMFLGAERMTLEVRPSNTVAQELYRKTGFTPVGVRKGYYTDTNEDAIIMWRNLYDRG
ncbi:ribosomal protein S18-alanine N-acetyltransferase [Zhaonella formicivorans]|uniref:ribosomal protein S18-alanine N-acetyltransferase n=1 Tax=Zhaonella formicivorans TaxID=2528593 RepID=UPI001D1055A2|nr:ribosomal protein S18-alanine N-acetyltransferase [Zhaonella formicivorans]